jgi:hypothetical protein
MIIMTFIQSTSMTVRYYAAGSPIFQQRVGLEIRLEPRTAKGLVSVLIIDGFHVVVSPVEIDRMVEPEAPFARRHESGLGTTVQMPFYGLRY